ncbi:MAG: hypothetical protein IIB29_15335 [Chloroflexi bacterium]|nr:hypothetical protein [Chloroflexota bacterium]
MQHLMIATALLVFAGLGLIFVSFSDAAAGAATFAVLSYTIMLLLTGSAGGFAGEREDYTGFLGPLLGPGWPGFGFRIALASSAPIVLLLIVALLPELNDSLEPNEALLLASTFAVFWLLMSMALVGAVLGFLWPATGAFQAVLVGGVVVLTQGLLAWSIARAGLDSLLLALYTWMVWVSVCLVGAWVGGILREISDLNLRLILDRHQNDHTGLAVESPLGTPRE